MITKGNITGLTSEEMAALNELFEQESCISQVILFGSRAMGNFRPGSDIDLTFKGNNLNTSWLMSF